MKAKLDKFDYKIILLKGGSPSDTVDLTKYISSHTSSQEVELENDKFGLIFNLKYTYRTILGSTILAHQFVDEETGRLIFSKKDIVKIYVKQNGTIDTTEKTDLLAEYFIQDYKVSSQAKKIEVNFVNINYKIYNRVWSGSYGVKATGTYTSTSTNTMTDSGASWSTNQFAWKTLNLKDVNGVDYNYLITSNTSDTLTLHRNIITGNNTEYIIGDSSPVTLYEALKRVTPTINFNGLYNLEITRAANSNGIGVNYLRNDNYAFPIIDYSQNRKPYHKLIAEISSTNAINSEYELNNNSKLYTRDMIFNVEYDVEQSKYSINWYYPDTPEKLLSSTVVSRTDSTITNSGGMTVDAYKGKLLRINNKSYNILSNTADTFTLSASNLTSVVSNSDTFIILDAVDFVWDSDLDFAKIQDAILSSKTEDKITHIYFNCGTNKLNQSEITGHLLKDGATSIVETFIPMTYIAKEVLKGDGRLVSGSYVYPSYPHTISNINGEPLIGAVEVNSDSSYDTNFRTVCREKAYLKCREIFANVSQGSLNGTFVIKGNKFVTAGFSENTNKVYHKGTQILYKNIGDGIVNEDHVDGYYILKVDEIRHSITTNSWTTTLRVSYDVFATNELNNSLS